VADNYSQYDRVVAVPVFGGVLYHETDLEIAEHCSDAGASPDQVFGICNWLASATPPHR
jgi:hypothetical protein